MTVSYSLVPYIDWKPFFDTWQLRGKYPNSRYIIHSTAGTSHQICAILHRVLTISC